MIRAAQISDIEEIMAIIEDTIEIMGNENNPQWSDEYPQRKDFINDINENTLFVFVDENQVGGLVCINSVEPDEYKPLHWHRDEKALIIHRMAVAPKLRKSGVGRQLLEFVDQYAIEQRVCYLKTDTFSYNEKMKKLLTKHGYAEVGYIYFRGIESKFCCFDKILANRYKTV